MAEPERYRYVRPQDRALLVAIDEPIALPVDLAFEHIEQVPPFRDRAMAGRLRREPLDAAAWQITLDQVRQSVETVARDVDADQRLHLFVRAPYPVVCHVGRCLDETRRSMVRVVYQLDDEPGGTGQWEPFLMSSSFDASLKAERYFGATEEIPIAHPGGGGLLWSIDVIRLARPNLLLEAAARIGAAKMVRVQPRRPGDRRIRGIGQARGALNELIGVYDRLHDQHAGTTPLHIVTSAPSALMLELSIWLRKWGAPLVMHHLIEQPSAHYAPILDLTIGQLFVPPAPSAVASLLATPTPPPTPVEVVTRLRILAVNNEWDSGTGGISTFNRDLCRALQRANNEVFCLVPRSLPPDPSGVQLIQAQPTPGKNDWELLAQPAPLPPGVTPDVILGYGRIAGPSAQAQHGCFRNAKLVHFLLMSPQDIEPFKPGPDQTAKAEERRLLEIELCHKADLVAALGPLLYSRFVTDMPRLRERIMEFQPGMVPDSTSRHSLPVPRVLLIGRAEDEHLKGLFLGARAVSRVDRHRLDEDPELIIRGAQPGQGDDLCRRLREMAQTKHIFVRPFTTSVKTIQADLESASLLIMPSRTEGFGLVGLEAIAAGIPILLSEDSGLYRLVRKLAPEEARWIGAAVPEDEDKAVEKWAQQIEFVLQDREAAFRRAAHLREKLTPLLTWEHSVQNLLGALARVPKMAQPA